MKSEWPSKISLLLFFASAIISWIGVTYYLTTPNGLYNGVPTKFDFWSTFRFNLVLILFTVSFFKVCACTVAL
jgi:hypothetical protein